MTVPGITSMICYLRGKSKSNVLTFSASFKSQMDQPLQSLVIPITRLVSIANIPKHFFHSFASLLELKRHSFICYTITLTSCSIPDFHGLIFISSSPDSRNLISLYLS